MIDLNKLFYFSLFFLIVASFISEIFSFTQEKSFLFLLSINPFQFAVKIFFLTIIIGIYLLINKNDLAMSTLCVVVFVISIIWIIYSSIKFFRLV